MKLAAKIVIKSTLDEWEDLLKQDLKKHIVHLKSKIPKSRQI